MAYKLNEISQYVAQPAPPSSDATYEVLKLSQLRRYGDIRLSENPVVDPEKGGIPRFVQVAHLAKAPILNGSEGRLLSGSCPHHNLSNVPSLTSGGLDRLLRMNRLRWAARRDNLPQSCLLNVPSKKAVWGRSGG
ncbi:hypothetical protein QJS04_geneDACA016269 [Acorus gramineus]|uniref:Uncharacterized protein n=1 Tax=Acorus gramineus TaxID=55184 RepID=A0AAV9AI87_ACOGR|nr:hypothetical protein QJS04_geneDACA016269 [Acorus gramineus]